MMPHDSTTTTARRRRRRLRAVLLTLAATVLLAGAALMALAWIMTDRLLAPPDHRGLHVAEAYRRVYRAYPGLEAWHDSVAARGQWRDTTLVNAQGLVMHAIYVPCDGATATAIVCHGYQDNAPTMMRYTYLYNHELGMNTLMPEWQYHGTSGGDHIQMGWMDRLDALRFVALAHDLWPDLPVVMHGVSMGAATVLCAAGEGTPDYVRAFVADCSFTSARDEFDTYFRANARLPWMNDADTLPAFPFNAATSLVCRLRYGWTLDEASPLRMTERIHRPVFFIHGDGDTFVPTAMVHRLYAAKVHGERQLWTPPCADHARTIHDHWDEYVARTRAFLAHALQLPDSALIRHADTPSPAPRP